MKKYYLSLIVILCTLANIHSQGVGDLVILNADIKTTGHSFTLSGNSLPDDIKNKSANYLPANYYYKVVSIDQATNTVELQALPFEPISKEDKEDYYEKYDKEMVDLSDIYNYKVYSVAKSDFDAYHEVLTNNNKRERISFGILTLPFKARPQDDFSFSSEFNLNTTVNVRLVSFFESSFNFQFGGGIGTVNLNTSNADGLSDHEAQDISTLTLLSGLMYQYNKVQVGLYLGWDHINNQSNYQWKDNGNLWLAFGVGYDLFNIAVSRKKQKND